MSYYDYTWKIMMLGDETAGKTSLTIRYISGFFLDDLKLTIGVDFYSKTTNYNGRRVKLQIWDFGGEERFRFLLHQYCVGANAAFFMYNITIPNSLDQLPEWTRIIREHAGDIPIMLVGTNVHLAEQRAVTREEGIQAVREHALSGFVEISSKTGQNVKRVFEVITELLFERYALNINLERPIPRPKPRHIPRALPRVIPRAIPSPTSRLNRKHLEFKVNDYITLKLEKKQSNIYVGGRIFRQCKYLLLNIPIDKIRDYSEIESIDQAAKLLQSPQLARRRHKCKIPPETEFWGHCSNIQAWEKFGYDTRILHRNLAFPLLKALVTAGDPRARKMFKEEIALRLESGYPSVVIYLINQSYLDYLDEDELDTVLESPKFLKNVPYSIMNQVPEWLAEKIRKNLENLN